MSDNGKILQQLKEEIEEIQGTPKMHLRAKQVIAIAKAVAKYNGVLPKGLVFKAAVQAVFGTMNF